MEIDKNSVDRALLPAVRYLSYQPRSIYEIKQYLEKKEFDGDVIKKVITNLLEENYLNDENFTKLYVESMVKSRPKSKFAMGFALRTKGVDTAIIEPVLEQYEDFELAVKAVKPKMRIWHNLSVEKFKKKLMNFLTYRGFNYDVCISTLELFEKKRL